MFISDGIFIALGMAIILFVAVILAAFLKYNYRQRNNPSNEYNQMPKVNKF